ncbi:hypothetical protein ACI8AV_18070 [Geodermatophilus sp. SYSU D00804]
MRSELLAAADAAFRAHREATEVCGPVVTPGSRPIAWFGDTAAYAASPLRILTAGLNPSQVEFPAEQPDQRFPAARGVRQAGDAYVASLNDYFRVAPYWRWFNTYRPLLEGLQASFDGGFGASTAVHTDLCSPVPTSPTWSRLPAAVRAQLSIGGVQLWHELTELLRPDVVLLSLARGHLSHIVFPALDPDWSEWFAIPQPARPYVVLRRRYQIGGRPVLFVWGRAANTPFGSLSYPARRRVGARILEEVA